MLDHRFISNSSEKNIYKFRWWQLTQFEGNLRTEKDFIALSGHFIPISDLLKTIFAIATDCLWHMLVAGDRDISQPLQCSLGLNYQCWRQTAEKILCRYHFQNKEWFERCNFCSKELLHLTLECAQCLFMLHVLSWFCSVQDKIKTTQRKWVKKSVISCVSEQEMCQEV